MLFEPENGKTSIKYFSNMRKKKLLKKLTPKNLNFFSIPQICIKICPYKRFSPHFKGPQNPSKIRRNSHNPTLPLVNVIWTRKWKNKHHNTFQTWEKKNFWKNWPPKISIFSPYHKSVSKFAHIRDFHPTLKAPRPVKNPEELPQPDTTTCECYLNQKMEKQASQYFSNMRKKKLLKKLTPKNLGNFFSIPQICIKICPYKRFSPHFKGPQTRQKSGGTPTTRH